MLPTGVKNLLIVNVLFFLATYVFQAAKGIDLNEYLALYYVADGHFHFWQYFTYMFMHANLDHIFFNMFALWMFGYVLENLWGTRRFLFFYLFCGLGAALFNTLVNAGIYHHMVNAVNLYAQNPNPDAFMQLVQGNFKHYYNHSAVAQFVGEWRNAAASSDYALQSVQLAQQLADYRVSIPTVGASGAIYGILLAFGMTFPEERIYLYFLVPLKAKWFVIGYVAIELFEGIFRSTDGIAHFAHLGGMLFGLILILIWRRQARNRWRIN